MGFLNKKKTTSTSITNIGELSAATNDNRVVQDGGNIGGNASLSSLGDISNVNILTTDYGVIDKTVDLLGDAIKDVFSFADKSLAGTVGVLNNTLSSNSSIVNDALNSNSSILTGALSNNSNILTGALSNNSNILTGALSNNSNILNRVLDFAIADRSLSNDIQRSSLSAINRNLGSALDFATDSRLEDGGQSGDILKLAIMAAAAVGAVALLFRG